ncbi:discoidin domain-containing protein [Catenuloplanes sp. NPDC051500]|uniref:discoidin domain-containing protein n=1 Tax=Catenuloplanes sp. NPDC051500 TaxID=3363959 RepID=UPI003793CED1
MTPPTGDAPAGSDLVLATTIAPPADPPTVPSRRVRPWLVGVAVVAVVGLVAVLVPLLQGSDEKPDLAVASSAPAELPWNIGYPSGPSTVDAAGVTPSPSSTAAASVSPTPGRTSAASAKPSPSKTPSPKATGPRANPSGANIALGKPVFASTESAEVSAAKAVDGDMSTRWSSAYSAPEWIMVDLGETWKISSVTLFWETAYGRSYRVEVSADGKTWKSIYSTTSGEGGTVKAAARSGTTGRYVRLYGTEVATIWGFSIFEMEVR